jgi:fatty acid desaturase
MSAVLVPQFPRTTPLPNRTEWPTVAVAGCIAAGLVAVVLFHERMPMALTVAVLSVLGAWYGSLQHEVIHGHPTRWHRVNLAFVVAPLGLVVPFWVYRESHLTHHIDENLTDPLLDPESYYVAPALWHEAGALHRSLLQVRRTLLGRLLLGPVVAAYGVARFMWRDNSVVGRLRFVRAVCGSALLLLVVRAAGVPVWMYVVGFGYFGQSLSQVRSFAEHRAVPTGERAAVVTSNWFWRLLFLNNNFHVTHHRFPGVSWFCIPDLHRTLTSDADAAAGAGLYRGYGEIFRRYLVRPFCQPVSPLLVASSSDRAA